MYFTTFVLLSLILLFLIRFRLASCSSVSTPLGPLDRLSCSRSVRRLRISYCIGHRFVGRSRALRRCYCGGGGAAQRWRPKNYFFQRFPKEFHSILKIF